MKVGQNINPQLQALLASLQKGGGANQDPLAQHLQFLQMMQGGQQQQGGNQVQQLAQILRGLTGQMRQLLRQAGLPMPGPGGSFGQGARGASPFGAPTARRSRGSFGATPNLGSPGHQVARNFGSPAICPT